MGAGEWTDDTSMAIAIAEVSAEGLGLLSPQAQDRVAARWSDWAKSAKDVGHQTRSVLGAARQAAAQRGEDHPNAGDLASASQPHYARTGRSGGNGSLMRTAPVALAYLDDEAGLVEAAQQLSALTHFDPEAGEACALWSLAARGGRDADTVAAIAGGLLGGVYGASAVPAAWRRKLHGWPGLRARDLVSFGAPGGP